MDTLDDILAATDGGSDASDDGGHSTRSGFSSRHDDTGASGDGGGDDGEDRTFNFGGGLDMLLNKEAMSAGASSRALSSNHSDSDHSERRSERQRSEHSAEEREKPKTYEEIQEEKQNLLFKLDRFRRKGLFVTRKYNMTSNIEDLRYEYKKLKRQYEVDISIKFQRNAYMTFTSGVEFVNSTFLSSLGLKLNGWSQSEFEKLDDYDEVFEELHDKYSEKVNVSPEIKLLGMVGFSAFTFHMMNNLFKNAPDLKNVLKQNPDLAKQFAQATMNTMSADPRNADDPLLRDLRGAPARDPNRISAERDYPNRISPERDYEDLRRDMESHIMPRPAATQNAGGMKGPDGVDDLLAELQASRDSIRAIDDDGASATSGGSSKKPRRPKRKRQTLKL